MLHKLLCSTCFCFFLLPLHYADGELISTSIAAVSAVAVSGFLAGYGYFKCKYYECCEPYWIPDAENVTGLKEDLHNRLYGQHLVEETVVRALRGHLKNKSPKKALTLSFHGWTGGGKNYVSRMIAENLYRKGMASSYVHLFISTYHFPHAEKVSEYKESLRKWIHGNVTQCSRSLFIFDELDKMSPGVLDAIKPYLEGHKELHGVDYRKSIFVFLSNTGGNDITQRTFEHWQKGRLRERISLVEMEEVVNVAAFNEDGGLRFSQLISSHMIDHFIPFLPLERSHVRLCIADYFKEKGLPAPTDNQVVRVLENLQFFPKETKTFSSSGCKRVAQKVELLLEEELEEAG